MAEQDNNLSSLLQDVFTTQDDEIQCEKASVLMVQSAAAQLMPEDSQAQYPAMWRHFALCSNCAEEYELLWELSRREITDQLVAPSHIPPLPDGGGAARWQQIKDAIIAIFPGFSPEMATAVTRGQESLFDPVVVHLMNGRLSVELDMSLNEETHDRRDLFCTMMSEDEVFLETLDGVDIYLQTGYEGPALYQTNLQERDATFSQVMPGSYTLRWSIAGQEWAIMNIILP